MQRQPAPGDRSTLLAYLFWIFGFIGLHRFYLGRPISWRHLGPNNGPFAGRLAHRPLSHSVQWSRMPPNGIPPKPQTTTLAWVLLVLLGIFGAHRFYQGKILSGFLYLFTLGVFGLGIIYDLFTLNEQIAEANTRPSGRDHAPEDKLAQTCLLTLGS